MTETTASRAPSPLPPSDTTLSHPRILCLHGGGVTGEIFRLQARALIKHLPAFRLVFADGPFLCDAGPGIIPVYQDHGPFRRWLRWLPEHPPIDDESAIEEVLYNIQTAKDGDEGTGAWVGLLGFSQGAKLASSLLYDQQVRVEKEGKAETEYKFAVLLAGRSPLRGVSLRGREPACVALADDTCAWFERPGTAFASEDVEAVSRSRATTVIEWEGTHRVPIKKTDVEPIADAIYKVAREQGVDV
ncbi:hypothetical protein LTR57_013695 [Friedmanniomyces endolithicus]|nr:hypothetical protein LTR57_013695 [Friedmanniomyces endolithicus]